MRRPFSRLAAACAFAVAMTAFTGSAFAGNGQGNDTAPGQLKQDQAAASQPAVATQAAEPAQPQTGHDQAPGQVKKEQQPAASTQSSSSQQSATQTGPGVKPNSNTTHWTHCVAGGTVGAATCTSSDNGHTPQPNADASKRYGNGTTAAQIVVSRGGGGVQLTGPGNSQPHKVHACGKPNNKSGGVDVHAVKSYLPADCAPATTPPVAPVAPCGSVVVATTSEGGKSHGHGKGLSHNKHEKSTTSFSLRADSTQSCSSAATGTSATQQQSASASVTPAVSPVTQSSPATQSIGGVAGAQTTLKLPKPGHGGVLGTVTNVAGTSLPFTGFPVWLAVAIAIALILTGLAVRRRGSVTSV